MLKSDPIAYPPRGLSREEAARYVGVSPTKFDEMVATRAMPKPRQHGGRVIWDRAELDMAFSDLPHQGSDNKLDRIFGS
jgi:predicted DNA-binding transcriptional regulator AlpA